MVRCGDGWYPSAISRRPCLPFARRSPGGGDSLPLLLRRSLHPCLPHPDRHPLVHQEDRHGQSAGLRPGDHGIEPARRHLRARLPGGGALRRWLRLQRAGTPADPDRPAAAPRHRLAHRFRRDAVRGRPGQRQERRPASARAPPAWPPRCGCANGATRSRCTRPSRRAAGSIRTASSRSGCRWRSPWPRSASSSARARTFRYDTRVGDDVTLDELLKRHDAVFVGVGLGQPASPGLPGEDLPGVRDALPFIEETKTRPLDIAARGPRTCWSSAPATPPSTPPRPRAGSAPSRSPSSTAAPRPRSPATRSSSSSPSRTGVRFQWLTAPKRIVGLGKGRGARVRADPPRRARREGAPPPGRGAGLHVHAPGRHGHQGRGPGAGQRASCSHLGLHLKGPDRLAADRETGATSHPRVFAGGDIVDGRDDATVVAVVAMGLRAAAGIDESLGSPRGAGRHRRQPARKQSSAGAPPDDPRLPISLDDRPELQRGGHQEPEPVLAGLRAADELRRPGHARVRRRLGRRRLEDARRADRQRLEPRYGALDCERPAHDGPEQHRAHHRPAARGQPPRDRRGQEALPEARRHRLADGRVEARGLARHRQAAPRTPAPTASS